MLEAVELGYKQLQKSIIIIYKGKRNKIFSIVSEQNM